MAIEIRMPKLSDTMKEGILLAWRVSEGERVKCGDILAEIETDKAAMEMEAFEDGVVSRLEVAEGETVQVGELLAVLDAVTGQPAPAAETAVESPVAPQPPAAATPAAQTAAASAAEQLPASPAARKLARELGLDLQQIHGSGPGGRIVLADVERARPERVAVPEPKPAVKPVAQPVATTPESPGIQAEPFPQRSGKSVKIRRLVARKMEEAWKSIPHFYVTMPVDMTDVIRFRKDLGFTINDFVLAATSHALQEHPWVNGMWDGEKSVELPDINLSMAVATERGLYNPVLHNCEKLSLRQISDRARELGEKAHAGKLSAEEMAAGSFTITNMGMLGVESFGAIITPPQAAVLAIGTVKGEIVVDEQGEPAVAPMMRLTLSADHRILDGADAAEFLDTLKSYLEAPIMLVAD